VTKDFFQQSLSQGVVTLMLHSLTAGLALFLTYKIRPRPISLLYSFIYMAALFILTFFLSSPLTDINCVYQSCVPKYIPTSSFYEIFWILIMAAITFSVYEFQFLLFRISQRTNVLKNNLLGAKNNSKSASYVAE
jgi:hypothetical protein